MWILPRIRILQESGNRWGTSRRSIHDHITGDNAVNRTGYNRLPIDICAANLQLIDSYGTCRMINDLSIDGLGFRFGVHDDHQIVDALLQQDPAE